LKSDGNTMMHDDPIAGGGIGGSGTRVVAAILRATGFDIGGDLNHALDNLWFTFLFKDHDVRGIPDDAFRQRVALLHSAMCGGPPPTAHDEALIDALAEKERAEFSLDWYRQRARTLRAALARRNTPHAWAWKEPNTHIVLDRLAAALPGLRYIHVARNGLDMAHSDNQTQLQVWGKLAFGRPVEVTPRQSVKFWCWAHQRVLKIGEALGSRFLFVRFEDLCANPEHETSRILSFAGIEPDADLLRRTAALPQPSMSIGRYKAHDLGDIDAADIQYIGSLGFDVPRNAS
jgi:Sulfotransferase family